MLPFYYFPLRNVQFSTIWYNPLSVRHVSKLPCLLLSCAVFLVDGDIGSLPVDRLAVACYHFPLVLIDFLEINLRIEGLLFERLIVY